MHLKIAGPYIVQKEAGDDKFKLTRDGAVVEIDAVKNLNPGDIQKTRLTNGLQNPESYKAIEHYMHPARLAEAFRRLYKDSEGFRETYETGGPANTAAWWLREMDDLKLKDGKIPLERDASGNLDTDADGSLTFKPKDTNILKADNFKALIKWIPCFGELLIQKSTSIEMNKAIVKGLGERTLEDLSTAAGMTGLWILVNQYSQKTFDDRDIFHSNAAKIQDLLYKKVLQTIQEGTVQRNKATLDALCNKLEKLEVQKIAEKFEGSNYLSIWIPVLQSILKPTKEWSFEEHVLGTMTTVGQHKLFVVLSCMADFVRAAQLRL